MIHKYYIHYIYKLQDDSKQGYLDSTQRLMKINKNHEIFQNLYFSSFYLFMLEIILRIAGQCHNYTYIQNAY